MLFIPVLTSLLLVAAFIFIYLKSNFLFSTCFIKFAGYASNCASSAMDLLAILTVLMVNT